MKINLIFFTDSNDIYIEVQTNSLLPFHYASFCKMFAEEFVSMCDKSVASLFTLSDAKFISSEQIVRCNLTYDQDAGYDQDPFGNIDLPFTKLGLPRDYFNQVIQSLAIKYTIDRSCRKKEIEVSV